MMESKNMMIVWAVVAVAVIGGGAFFFLGGSEEPAPATTGTTNVVPADPNNPAEEMDAEAEADKTFEVDGSNFEFSMDEIRVSKGETVRIVFSNIGGTHNWTIDEFSAATKTIGTGESETIEFVADQAGTFEYYCSVGNHRALGMVGNLIVE